ncbi:hypothetical protein ABEB22_03725 [Thioclava sp. 'Guangxiensis']|uniref:hypothetical protein n=1 Tax=Thioclava sp. 'Guangxiensis' TaxID=3149044 RepID=UPI003877EA16
MTQIASHLVTLRLPAEMIRQIELSARAQAKAPADIIRGALLASLSQEAASVTERLRKQASLTQCFDLADGWLDLQAQLRSLGYVLRHDGEGRVALHEFPSNDFLCTLHDIGQNQGELTRRYQSPFPGLVPEKAPEPVAATVKAPLQKAAAPMPEIETEAAEPVSAPATETVEEDESHALVFHSLRKKPRAEIEKPKLVSVPEAPPKSSVDELREVLSGAMFRSRRKPVSEEPDLLATRIAS